MPTPTWIHDDDVRERIEAALPLDARATLAALVRGAAVYSGGWLQVPAWRVTFGTLAALAVIGDAQSDGCTLEAALDRAAGRLGIPRATLTTWVRRSQSQARKWAS